MLWLNKLFEFWGPVDLAPEISHVRNRQRRERRVLQILDGIGFSWRVYLVAFFGFLASSWSLIAINITMPALYFVYEVLPGNAAETLDEVTLAGTVLGMILFGHLADRLGRSALYGFELLIVLSAVGGASFTSQGYTIPATPVSGNEHSLNIYAALLWWRFILGLGIGAEYPMSAIIAAEFSSTAWRGTMLAAIFIAQPVGRLLAYGLSLAILQGFAKETSHQYSGDVFDPATFISSDDKLYASLALDKAWRLVIGLAGVPAMFAIVLRIFIPETPRFYSAIKRDLNRAREVAIRIGSASLRAEDAESVESEEVDEQENYRPSWATSAWSYLFGPTQGWKRLLAITLQWALLDVCFYGTGLDTPSTLAVLWVDKRANSTEAVPDLPPWHDDPSHPRAGIFWVMAENSRRTLLTTSLAATVGSILAIPLVGFITRKTLYVTTSGLLTLMFAATAIAIRYTYASPVHTVSIVFYAITQFLFNIGPNTLTFIIAAEIAPTEFRGTFYGIAAAGGKVGAIIIRAVVAEYANSKDEKSLSILLGIFAAIMALMMILAWIEPFGIGFPKIQEVNPGETWLRRLENLSLEDISPWPVIDGFEDQAVHTENEMAQKDTRTTSRTELEMQQASNVHDTPIASSYLDPKSQERAHMNGASPMIQMSTYHTHRDENGWNGNLPPPAMRD